METEFVEMINQNRRIIYKVCNLYLDDQEDKKDLFQEITLQLWKGFQNFRKESKPSTWMYRIAINVAISYFRKEKRKPERQSLTDLEMEIPDMSVHSEDQENLRLLQLGIQQLSNIEKALILLYLEEKTYEEIGDILGISKSNVGVKINRVKIKLEKIIKSQGYSENRE